MYDQPKLPQIYFKASSKVRSRIFFWGESKAVFSWITKVLFSLYSYLNKFAQKCQYYYTLLDQSIPLGTVSSFISLLRKHLCERVKCNFKMVLTSLWTREILYCWTIKVDIKSPSPKRNHSLSLFSLFIFQSLGTQGTAFKKSYSVECINALRGHENNVQSLILKWASS